MGVARCDRVRRTGCIGEALEVVGAKVAAGDSESFYDGAADRTVPAVVAEGAEIGLVHGSANETGRQSVMVQHVAERVRLTLEPERGRLADIGAAAQEDGAGFAGVVDEGCVLGNGAWLPTDGRAHVICGLGKEATQAFYCEGPHAFTKLPGEEIVPGGEAIVLGGGVADVELCKSIA